MEPDKDKKPKNGEPEGTTEPTATGEPTGATGQTGDKVEFDAAQQAHLDRIISERLTRAKTQWEKEQETARKKVEDEAEQKRLTEQAEWQKLAEKRETQVAEMQAERDRLSADLTNVRIRHAVEIAAAGMDFQSPADAFDLADLTGVEITDDGEVTGVKEALEALVKAKPYLVKAQTGGGFGTPRRAERKPKGTGEQKPAQPTVRF